MLSAAAPAIRQPSAAPARPDLIEWAEKQTADADRLLAAGVLRLARQFDAAEQVLSAPVSESVSTARDNERAALAWHRGNHAVALALWQSLPESAPVLFNVGMAQLFTGERTKARISLAKAAKMLPEQSAWHHLAELYLALASA